MVKPTQHALIMSSIQMILDDWYDRLESSDEFTV